MGPWGASVAMVAGVVVLALVTQSCIWRIGILNIKTCFSCRLRIIIESLGTHGPIYGMADAHNSTSFTPKDDQVDGPSSAIDSCTLQPSLSLGSELPPVVLHAVTSDDQSF